MINLLYLIYKILINGVAIDVLFQEKITTFSYLIVFELVISLKMFMKYIEILILLRIYIEFKI